MDVKVIYEEDAGEELDLLAEEVGDLSFRETIFVKLFDNDSEFVSREVFSVLDNYEDALDQIEMLNKEDVASIIKISRNISYAEVYLENSQYDGNDLLFEETLKIKNIKF